MKTIKKIFLNVVFFFLALTAFAAGQNETERLLLETLKSVAADFPDVALAVAVKSSDVDFSYVQGKMSLQGGKPAQNTSLFHHWCSGNSTISALALVLCEQGVLSMSAKVSDFLPAEMFNSRIINTGATIEMLLKERTGIPNFSGETTPALLDASVSPFLQGKTNWSPEVLMNFAQTLVDERRGAEGKEAHSTFNQLLLGMVIEKATGKKINELLKETFFTPLNLDIRLAPQDKIDYGNVPHGHVLNSSGSPVDFSSLLPYSFETFMRARGESVWTSAGYFSTIHDIACWAYELYSDKGKAVSANVRRQIWDSLVETEKSKKFRHGLTGMYVGGISGKLAANDGGNLGEYSTVVYDRSTDTAIAVHYCLDDYKKIGLVRDAISNALQEMRVAEK